MKSFFAIGAVAVALAALAWGLAKNTLLSALAGIFAFGTLLCLLTAIGFAVALRGKKAAAFLLLAFVCAFVFSWAEDNDAVNHGFADAADMTNALEAGVPDAATWSKERDRVTAEKKAKAEKDAAEAKAKREKEASEARERKASAFAGSKFDQVTDIQKQFIQAIEKARADYAAAENDMVRGGTRAARAKAVCSVLKGRPDVLWVGKIKELSSNSEGRGVLAVSVGPDITLMTMNNSFSDMGRETLIDPESPLFEKASKLKKDAVVKVRGKLFFDKTDCVAELSLTLKGSIAEPEYLFKFADITAVE
jgi:hypothetical protein